MAEPAPAATEPAPVAAESAFGIAARVAGFAAAARFDDLSDAAVQRARDAITDAVGVALAGQREPIADVLRRAVVCGDGPAFVFGGPDGVSCASAALANGGIVHALDYDDTSHPAYSHPSAHIAPVLLALAAGRTVSGRDAIVAYAVGHEVEGKLARALTRGHYDHGWHSTGSIGAVSSAATAAVLLGLSERQTVTALGIGASMASGLRVAFGTMTKPLHAGLAARAGIEAALLATAGLTAAADGLGGRFGYLDVMGETGTSAWERDGGLGDPWELDSPFGLALKPFPSCGSTHCGAEAAIRIHALLDGDAIARVRVGTNTMCEPVLVFHRPQTPLQGKFSMEYCVARGLLHGRLGLPDFTDAAIADPTTRALMERITLEVDDRVRDSSEHGAVVTVETAGGARHEELVELAAGKPARWPSRDERWRKFRECAAAAPAAATSALFEALQGLPAVRDVGAELLPTLRAASLPGQGAGLLVGAEGPSWT